jgi:hypothetical protein
VGDFVDSPKAVALRYHEAFYRNDRPAVRRLLADQGSFVGPLSSFTDPEAFLDAARPFMVLATRAPVKQAIAEGDHACIVYDMETKLSTAPRTPIASWFEVKQGKIVLFHTHFDPRGILQAKESGELARALEAAR